MIIFVCHSRTGYGNRFSKMLDITTNESIISDDTVAFGPVVRIGSVLHLWAQGSAATAISGYGVLYFRSSDGKLYYKTPNNIEYSVGTTGGSYSVCTIEGISLDTLASSGSASLSGVASKSFIPTHIEAISTSAPGTQNGDAAIIVGTTLSGTDICTSHPIPIEQERGTAVITLEGGFPPIAGNATLYAQVSIADTNVASDIMVTLYIYGREY